jgi:hypothetical protein
VYLCVVVSLPPGKSPFEVQINNNNNEENDDNDDDDDDDKRTLHSFTLVTQT